MAKKKAVEAKPKATKAAVELVVGQTYSFSNDPAEYLGTVRSLDPCVLTVHSVRSGVHAEDEVTIDPKDYHIEPVSDDEVFRRTAN